MIDLSNFDLPKPFVTLILGISIGASVAYFGTSEVYEKGKIPSLEQQLQAAEKKIINGDNDIQACYKRELDLSKNITQRYSEADVSALKQQLEQLTQWNLSWKNTNEKLNNDLSYWKSQANIFSLLREARERRDQMSNEIWRLTSLDCGKDNGTCDLVPIARRKLTALEKDRDNAQAQIIDLQTKLCK